MRHTCGGVCCPHGFEANAVSPWARGYSLADSPVRFRAFVAHSSARFSFPLTLRSAFAFATRPIMWCVTLLSRLNHADLVVAAWLVADSVVLRLVSSGVLMVRTAIHVVTVVQACQIAL